MDFSGVADMVTTSVYIAADTKFTFEASDNLGSAEAVRRVFIVVLLIGCIWAAGLISFFAEFVRPNMPFRTSGAPPKTAKQRVLNYVDNIIPRVFAEDQVVTVRILNELLHHHSFFRMFTMESRHKRQETIFKFLSAFTFMIFLVAVFYDVSSPDDDGSCADYSDEKGCLQRNSPFDHSQNYCKWGPSRHGNMECSFAKQQLSLKAMIYLSFLITVLTALMTIPNHYLYSIISSPTVENLQKIKLAESRRKLVSDAMLHWQQISTARKEEPAATRRKSSVLAFFSPNQDIISAGREIPESVAKSRAVAGLSLATVSKGATMIVEQAQTAQLKIKSRTLLKTDAPPIYRLSESSRRVKWADDGDALEGGVRSTEGTEKSPPPSERQSKRFQISISDISSKDDDSCVRQAVDQMCEDVICQRYILPDDTEETTFFDQQWGIEKATKTDNKATQYAVSPESYETLLSEVRCSTAEAKRLDSDVMSYGENNAGVEMLHVFMLDLLGRNTPAAKIFREKFGEEFEGARLVTNLQVYLSVITVACLNLFCLFYLILKGYTKGPKWQYQFFWSCAAQVLVDIFLFETTECIWLNYSIPAVVHREVQKAAAVVRDIVLRVTVTSHIQRNSSRRAAVFNGYFLNAPAHLFVSVKLAKAYPKLLESLIVTSYVHHLPGKLCYLWPHYREFKNRKDEEIVRRRFPEEKYCFSGTVVAMVLFGMWSMRVAAAIPFPYQKIIIRATQPIAFSILALIWYVASGNVYATISVAVFSVLLALMLTKCHIDMYKLHRHKKSCVVPAHDDNESDKAASVSGHVAPVVETSADDAGDSDRASDDDSSGKLVPLLKASRKGNAGTSCVDNSITDKVELAINKLAVGMVSELLNELTARRVAAASADADSLRAEELVAALISQHANDSLAHHVNPVRSNSRAAATDRAGAVVEEILNSCASDLAIDTSEPDHNSVASVTRRKAELIVHELFASYNRLMRNSALFTDFNFKRTMMPKSTNLGDDGDDRFSVSAASGSGSCGSDNSNMRSEKRTPRRVRADSSSSSGEADDFDDDVVDNLGASSRRY